MKVSGGRRGESHPNVGALEIPCPISLHSSFVCGSSGNQQPSRGHLPRISQCRRCELFQGVQEPAHPGAAEAQPVVVRCGRVEHHHVSVVPSPVSDPAIRRSGRLPRRRYVLRRGGGRQRLSAAQCHCSQVNNHSTIRRKYLPKTSKTCAAAHEKVVSGRARRQAIEKCGTHMDVENCVHRCRTRCSGFAPDECEFL